MKVVYKKLCEVLDEAIATAALQGKRIARFELTEVEFGELRRELASLCVYRTTNCPQPHAAYNGIPIKVIG